MLADDRVALLSSASKPCQGARCKPSLGTRCTSEGDLRLSTQGRMDGISLACLTTVGGRWAEGFVTCDAVPFAACGHKESPRGTGPVTPCRGTNSPGTVDSEIRRPSR